MYSLPFYLYVLGENMSKITPSAIIASITQNSGQLLDPEKIQKILVLPSSSFKHFIDNFGNK